MQLTFRDLAPGEIDVVVDLWVAAWSATLPTVDFETRRQWFRERLAKGMEEGFVIRCAVEGGDDHPIGFIAISPRLRYLDQIAVRPKRWGTGAAMALIDEARRLCRRGVVLDVNQNNPRAIAFYEKCGFRRLYADRNPESGRPTWWYAWGEAEPPRR